MPISKDGKNYSLPNKLYKYPLQDDDFYFKTQYGDRYDNIAFDYFQDATLWWIIPAINGLPKDTLYPPLDTQIRMITDVDAYLMFIENKNK